MPVDDVVASIAEHPGRRHELGCRLLQALLPLATEGVLRYVWESKFGPMLIEVVGGAIFVNGMAVEPAPR